ncbi:MAG: glutathione S-transferase family protein [Myxococcota bacterium]|jgi:glutathione S-transferase
MATLYHYMDCPYCFRVRAYLAERGIPYASNAVERGAPPPELPSLNPLGRLPIWVTDAGRPVFGSSTILTFLDATETASPGLLPLDPLARARCAMAEQMVEEGLLNPLMHIDREMVGREGQMWSLEVYRTETRRVRQMLHVFEQLLGGRQWLVGDALTPADLALAQPLTILERFGLDLQGLPGLAGLAERLNKRTSIVSARKKPETELTRAEG